MVRTHPKSRHPRQVARLISGYSQDDLALRLGKDRALISRWERGFLEFSADDVELIAELLDVPVDQLVVADEPTAVAQ